MGWANIASLVFVICMNITHMVTASDTIFTDELVLLAFKDNVKSDPNNVLANNWTRGTPVCTWYGVTCSVQQTRVISLKLPSLNLSSTIIREVGNLSFLVYFNIEDNFFEGNIPPEIGLLRRLKHLNLQYNMLVGSIPPSLGHLDSLQLLDISDNYLNGTMPFSIFNISSLRLIDFENNELEGHLPIDICHNLPRLQALYASDNKLGGRLPFLGNCKEAAYVSLSFNGFTGGVPKEIGNLSALQGIYLRGNKLTGGLPDEIGNAPSLKIISLRESGLIGNLPPSLGNLSNLQEVDLGHNNFLLSHIPPELGRLSNLQNLYLNFNNLSGETPICIFNISTLRVLALTGNNLSGELPSDIAIRLPNLSSFSIGMNRFTGPIPTSIANASKLIGFSIGTNSFSGHIPETLGNLPHLERIFLHNNLFTADPSKPELGFLPALIGNPSLRSLQINFNPLKGFLPKSLTPGNISSLEILLASGCGLEGEISSAIGNFSNLSWLALSHNYLKGRIPDDVGRLRTLERLGLRNNRIHGQIASGVCDLENLFDLSLSENGISGELPSCLGNVSSLRILDVGFNYLTSPLRLTFWSNKQLWFLSVAFNSLNGTIDERIGYLTNLNVLALSGNKFSGHIPNSIGRLKVLTALSLSENMLNGTLPQGLGMLTNLEYLDLSQNQISGEIPKSMTKLHHLKRLNLSLNELSGEIPNEKPFVKFSAESYAGNNALCGASRFNVPACKNEEQRSTRRLGVLKYILPVCGLVSLVTIGFVVWMMKFRKKNNKGTNNVETPFDRTKRFSYTEIAQGTNNFDEANLVGRGSYGVVYKGTFANDMVAAIKVFNLDIRSALKSFDVECEVLRNIRHRNLVKVISTCSNLDFKAIILEYMPNGSLDFWLHIQDNCLDLIQRLRVMIDVAYALEYLHHGYSFPMVHCDLKPSNILFNEDMIAHLADFGITKLIAEDKSSVQTKTLGTLGYMAPEYGSEGVVSTMADVYSFGILMMETFTGMNPTDENFTDDLTIRNWVSESLLQTDIMDVLDPKLLALIGNEQEVDTERACLRSIMELALACTDALPENRLDMENVLATLKKIKSTFR